MAPRTSSFMRPWPKSEKRKAAELARLLLALDRLAGSRRARRPDRADRVSLGTARY